MISKSSKRFLAQLTGDFTVRALALGSKKLSEAIDRAISSAEKGNQRDCPLKARLVFWLVLFLGIHRSRSIPDVFDLLLSFLKEREASITLKMVTPEALCHARKRLTSEPLQRAFTDLASSIQAAERYRGFRKLVIDATTFLVADTPSNVEAFGRHATAEGRDPAAYPYVVGVSLVDVASHRFLDVEFGKCYSSERELATRIIERSLGETDLVIMDRGLPSYEMIWRFDRLNSKFLARISNTWKPRSVRKLTAADELVELCPIPGEQARLQSLGLHHRTMKVRMISYHIPGGETIRLLTNLLDPKTYPATELTSLYQQRWETEIAFDEIKTHFLSPAKGTAPTNFRSKTPDGVLQEAYGALIAFNLVRELMLLSAIEHNLDPLSLSFVKTVNVLGIWCPRLERARSPSASFAELLGEISKCRLRPRRNRSYPRVVKIQRTKAPRKRSGDVQVLNRDLRVRLGPAS